MEPFELQPFELEPVETGPSDLSVSQTNINPTLAEYVARRESDGQPVARPLSPIEAGWNATQGMFWSAVESGAEASGQEVPEFVTNAIQENMDLASSADIEDIYDKLGFAIGQLGPVAGGIIAGSVVAPFVGASATVGAAATGILASMGLTAGDQQQKIKELDPDRKATLDQWAYTTALSSLDAFAIGRAKTLLSPIGELIEQTVKGNLRKATGVTKNVAELAKGTAQIAVSEGVQDLGTGLGANYFTGTEIDQSRIDALKSSAIDEMVIAALLGAPLTGANMATARLAQNQIEFDENRRLELEATPQIGEVRDKKGNIAEEVINLAPAKDSVKQPGFFNYAYNIITGNATSPLKARYADNKSALTYLRQFNLSAKERFTGQNTIAEKGQAEYAKFEKAGKDFFNATRNDQDAAWERKAKGEADMSNPIDKSLHEVLNVQIPKSAWIASRGKMDMTEGLWSREDYLPISDAINWNLVVNDPNYINRAKEILTAQGKEDKIDQVVNALRRKKKDFLTYGNEMHMGADRKSASVQRKFVAAVEKAVESGKGLKLKGLLKGAQQEYKPKQRHSSITLERELQELGQEWFLPYYDKKRSPAEVLRIHMKKAAESVAHINSFGVNLEKADELIARAIVEGQKNDNPLRPRDVEKMYDVLRASQRIHLNPVTRKTREAQQKARATITTMVLGLSALVSIPEAVVIGLQTDMRSMLKGLLATARLGDKERMLVASEDLGYSLASSTNLVFNRTAEETFDVPKWEAAFVKYGTGLPFVQHFLTTWAAKSQDIYLRRKLDKIKTGNASGAEANHIYRKLAEAGIDVEKSVEWANQNYPLDSDFFQNEWSRKLIAVTRDTIVDPDPIDKPLWQSDERFLLVAQLKGFMTVFTNRVMQGTAEKLAMEGPGANRELALRVAPYLTMYLLGQVAMGMAREYIKSGEVDDEKTTNERVWNAFGYAGSMAYFIDAINAFRYRSDPAASVAGPFFSITNQLAGSAVENLERMDPEGFMEDVLKRLYPNSPFKDLIVEAAME
jgi:hypothetical protein